MSERCGISTNTSGLHCMLPKGHGGEHDFRITPDRSTYTDSDLQAALAQLREPMACGHPKACWKVDEPPIGAVSTSMVMYPELYGMKREYSLAQCTACAHEETALALFAQRAAEHIPCLKFYPERICCSCGWEPEQKNPDAEQWSQHILALADPQALSKHDAALVAECSKECADSLAAAGRVVAAKEADNAALRSQLDGAISGRDYLLKQANDNIAALRSDVATFSAEAAQYVENYEIADKERCKLKAQIASAEVNARLDEAKVWNAEPDFSTLDHEYHVGFHNNCFECCEQRIAALEKQKAEGVVL